MNSRFFRLVIAAVAWTLVLGPNYAMAQDKDVCLAFIRSGLKNMMTIETDTQLLTDFDKAIDMKDEELRKNSQGVNADVQFPSLRQF
ncbi:MAG: hypothetical protein L0387_41605 [Acidobacteria bacterium]|nr:hypothetical protein [Acidobacteriota bacterium]